MGDKGSPKDPLDDGRRNELFLESIVENIPNMIFVKEAAELRFVRFNAAGERLLGYDRRDLIGRNDFDFFPEEQARFFTDKDREVLRGGVLVDIPEEPIDTAQGRRWLHTMKIPLLDRRGDALYLLGISEDITERKRAREQLEFLLAHVPGAMWTSDVEGRLLTAGGSRAEALGLEPGALVGDLLGPRVAEAHGAALRGESQDFDLGVGSRTYEVRVEALEREPDGARDGSPALTGVAIDVTERRKLAAERLAARLEASQKLELLGRLAGGIAHDFNNLLVGVLGDAELAQLQRREGRFPDEALQRIERAALRASELTRQLLAYSGRGRFVVERIDLNELVQELLSLLRIGIGRETDLLMEFEPDLPFVEADVAQLRQLVMNLITNAAEALDGRGSIRLRTRLLRADRTELSAATLDDDLPEGAYVCLEVEDDGCGMDQDTQERMFDPFFTTKESGHGLGLAAALGIVRGHGGALRVDSAPGRGTRVRVLFPPADITGTTATDLPAVAGPLPTGNATVLVVDDEEIVRDLARATLEHGGFQVRTVRDGVEALELLADPDAVVDVVLLDLTMPRMDGEETFREIRLLRPSLPILLSSGYSEQEAAARFAGRRLAGFLPKPYRASELLARIDEMLDMTIPD